MDPKTAKRSAAAFLLLALWTSAACTRDATPPGDILLISIDTLRSDHLGSYGYPLATSPNIGRFFRDGAVFENAYATSSYTTASMVSVLSGLLPPDHGVRLFDQLLSEDVALVTERLPAVYQTAAFVSNGVLSNPGLGIADRFDHYDDDVKRIGDTHRLERNAADTTDAVLSWLEAERDPARPLFLWVHYMDPHAPYEPPPDAAPPLPRSGADPPVIRHAERRPDVDPLERIGAYDREIAYTDREVGRLLDGYAERRDVDAALVLLTADHGETLAEREVWFQHAYHVYEEIVRVPLLLRGPGVAPGRRPALASGLDVLPTLLAFAGADASGLPGRDLRPVADAETETVVFVESINDFETKQWRAAITRDGKWLLRVGPTRAPRVLSRSYWDLARDPGEIRPLEWPDGGGPGEQLLALVARDPDPAGRPKRYRKGELSAGNAELLRALGYAR